MPQVILLKVVYLPEILKNKFVYNEAVEQFTFSFGSYYRFRTSKLCISVLKEINP